MSPEMLHLSIPIRDVTASLAFYRDLLGCTATRIRDDRIDFQFFGHHLVAQLSEVESAHRSVTIGAEIIRFGISASSSGRTPMSRLSNVYEKPASPLP